MNRRIILLGAPTTSSLNWDESSLLGGQEIHRGVDTVSSISLTVASPAKRAEWRQLRPAAHALEPSFLQPSRNSQGWHQSYPPAAASFFRTADISSVSTWQGHNTYEDSSLPPSFESSEDVLSEFYEHSFAVSEEIRSSGLDILEDATQRGKEMAAKSPGSILQARQDAQPSHLSDVEDIPSAPYLRSIVPQTITVNLIVGIISLPPPRTVTTGRRWGKEQQSELVEILVGDETKSGFGITLWLSNNEELRKQVQRLRLRDIVLFRNVALGSFRDQVHGQTLRRGITKVDLLYGRALDTGDSGRRGAYSARDMNHNNKTVAPDPQLRKVRMVKDWMDNFVSDGSHAGVVDPALRHMTGPAEDDARRRPPPLPPDTQ